MSIPRETISVAIRILILPLLNSHNLFPLGLLQSLKVHFTYVQFHPLECLCHLLYFQFGRGKDNDPFGV